MARPGAAPAFPIIAPPTTILRSWRRRKNEAIPGQGGLGDRKCWRPPAQAARAPAFCSDLQAPSPLHRAKHKKFVPAGAAAMASVMPENHDIGWRLADGSHRSLTQLAAKFPSWVDWQMRRLPPAIANSPRSARSCPNWGVRPRASRTTHRKYQSRGKRGRSRKRGSAPRFPAGSVTVIDGPKRLWGFAEAAGPTAGGFGVLGKDDDGKREKLCVRETFRYGFGTRTSKFSRKHFSS